MQEALSSVSLLWQIRDIWKRKIRLLDHQIEPCIWKMFFSHKYNRSKQQQQQQEKSCKGSIMEILHLNQTLERILFSNDYQL